MAIKYDQMGNPYDDGIDVVTGTNQTGQGGANVLQPPANDPVTIKNRTAQLRSLYWKYLFRLPTQDEFNGMALDNGLLTDEDSWKRVKDAIPSSQPAELAMREVGGGKPNTRTVPSGYDFGSSTDYDPAATGTSGTGGGVGTGYNLEKMKAAWLGAAGKYAPTREGLAKFIADNNGPGGFAEGVTIGGSKKNKLYLGNESGGTFLGDVIRGTDSNNPAHDWDTNTSSGGGGNQSTTTGTTAGTAAETPAQRAARMASFGLGPSGLQNQAPLAPPTAPRLGDLTGPQGPIQDPGTYTPGAVYRAPEYQAPDPYQAATPFSRAEYQAATPFARDEYQAATPFAAPTAADMAQDPGYQFRLSEGQKALERSGAARGVTNTGGTMKGILDYGQQAASQEYGNVYNRNLNTYNVNEANRSGAYGMNYGNALGAYGMNEQNRAGAYNTNYGNALNAYNTNEQNRAGAYATNAANQYQQYTTNALAQYTANQDEEARRSGAFAVNANLYQTQQNQAYDRRQNEYDQAMSQWTQKANQQRQYERDRMNDIQFAAGA